MPRSSSSGTSSWWDSSPHQAVTSDHTPAATAEAVAAGMALARGEDVAAAERLTR